MWLNYKYPWIFNMLCEGWANRTFCNGVEVNKNSWIVKIIIKLTNLWNNFKHSMLWTQKFYFLDFYNYL